VTGTLESEGGTHQGGPERVPLIAQTITAHQFRSNGATAGNNGKPCNLQVVAYPLQEVGKRTGASTDDVRCGVGIGGADDPMYTLQAGAQHGVVAFTERTRAEGRNLETQDELAYALTNPGSGGRTHSRQIAGSFGVRRLTPTECERLQGYPDGWTEYGDDGQRISDSARYRMLGNAVCVPTVEWIARRIMEVDAA
jgi:DNA (cytosine-5)-methyltransferase 1